MGGALPPGSLHAVPTITHDFPLCNPKWVFFPTLMFRGPLSDRLAGRFSPINGSVRARRGFGCGEAPDPGAAGLPARRRTRAGRGFGRGEAPGPVRLRARRGARPNGVHNFQMRHSLPGVLRVEFTYGSELATAPRFRLTFGSCEPPAHPTRQAPEPRTNTEWPGGRVSSLTPDGQRRAGGNARSRPRPEAGTPSVRRYPTPHTLITKRTPSAASLRRRREA